MLVPRVPPTLTARPFRLQYAQRLGVSRTALRSSPWVRLLRDVYVHCSLEDSRALRLEVAQLVVPDKGTLCGPTAAWLYGVDVQGIADRAIHVGFPPGQRIRARQHLAVKQETLNAEDRETIGGVAVTTPLRTAFDCARWLRGAERLVVVDALTHAKLVTLDDLNSYAGSKHRLRNLRRAIRLLELADPLSESPMETRVRYLIVMSGLPSPTSQVVARDATGRFLGRLDLAWPQWLVAVEYDGALHFEQRRADDRRRDRLREAGWDVLVFSAEDYYSTPERLLADISRHLQRRRMAR